MTVKTKQRTLTDDWELLKHRRFLEEQVRPWEEGQCEGAEAGSGRVQAPHPRSGPRGARVPCVSLREGRAAFSTLSAPGRVQSLSLRLAAAVGPGLGRHACAGPLTPVVSLARPSPPAQLLGRHPSPGGAAGRLRL